MKPLNSSIAANLLPIRILFHAALTIVYLPLLIVCIQDILYWSTGQFNPIYIYCTISCLAVLFLLDWLNFRWKPPSTLFFILEIATLAVVIGLNAPITREMQEDSLFVQNWALDDILLYLLEIVLVGVAGALVLLLVGMAAWNLILGQHPFTLFFNLPDEAESHVLTFSVTRRLSLERSALVEHCATYLFQHSIFRKHPFEPAAWAIFRGTIAAYCITFLVGYAAYLVVSTQQHYYSADWPVQESLGNVVHLNGSLTALGISTIGDPLTDLSIQSMHSTSLPPTPCQKTTASGLMADQIWICNASAMVAISWSGDTTVALSLSTSPEYLARAPGWFQGISVPVPLKQTPLAPHQNYTGLCTQTAYKLGNNMWGNWNAEMAVAPLNNNLNNTVATFYFDDPVYITIKDFTGPSAFAIAATVFSSIGGIFGFVEIVYATVFGRTIMAIIMGSRPISPFGFLGIFARQRIKRMIREEFPRLQDDCERGGMAAYIKEIGIDVGFLDGDGSMHQENPV